MTNNLSRLVCKIRGHEWEYTEEYESETGHVRADKICLRCHEERLGWTGPKAETMRDLGFKVPSPEEAYKEVLDQ